MVGRTSRTTTPDLCHDCKQPMSSPVCCVSCGALNPQPPENFDYFEMFELARGFDVDEAALHRKYLALSRGTHPDLAGRGSPADRERALSLNAELNRAYETLRDPMRRAEYLLSLAGGPSAAEDKSVPSELLGEVMMLREEVEEAEAGGDDDALRSIRERASNGQREAMAKISGLCRQLDEVDEQGRSTLRTQLNGVKYWINLLRQLPAD